MISKAPLRVSLIASLAAAAGCLIPASVAAQEKSVTYNFNREEIKILKTVLQRDKLMSDLTKSQSALSVLNKVLSYTAPGPLKLTFKWNQGAFEGWVKANSKLAEIASAQTCVDLLLPIVDNSPNAEFFENLRKIRGCD